MIEFAVAFERLTQHPPLPWQVRLYDEFMHGRLPSALDLPTGLGKTSVIAIWLAARASGARLPRRLVYVVDRRAVVDQATEVAEAIGDVLDGGASADATILALRVALGLEVGAPLPISTLRGQHVDNREWLESPTAPAIVVGTVDMIGSRLLFQGYGVSSRMRPVHAALLGVDSLLVLDEAHLVPPFEHLLRKVGAWPRSPGIPASHLLTLSATGRTQGVAPFQLSPEDRDDPRTVARLRASKRLKIEEANGDLSEAMAQRALELSQCSSRVIVFCDSRRVAQKVAERLRTLARAKLGPQVAAPALLVGGRRVWERARKPAEDDAFLRFQPSRYGRPANASGPAFLVATSAGEVGVDLDADHLVMDLVPWERMVQRLGRVNRRSDPGQSLVDVFVADPDVESESAAICDAAERDAWRAPFASSAWAADAQGRLDASPLALAHLKEDSEFARLAHAASTPEPLHPDLSAPVLEAWAMTSLETHPGRPNVAPWLRGWIEDEPQTRLVWRALFPVPTGDVRDSERRRTIERNLRMFFRAGAPHLSEVLEVPTFQAVDLVLKRVASWSRAAGSAVHDDKEDASALVAVLDTRNELERFAFVDDLVGEDTKRLVRSFSGRTLVLDARLGGLDTSGLLDAKQDALPVTLDAATDPAVEEWTRLAGFRVRKTLRDAPVDPDWPVEYRWPLGADDDESEELRVEVLRTKSATRGDAAVTRFAQGLAEHHTWTADEAQRIARRLELSREHETVLVAAAAIHDAGKARNMWQSAMRAPARGRPYAKTMGGGDFRALMIDGDTYRHEFGSVRDAEKDAAFASMDEASRDLALHLVAAHHGYARPFIAPQDPDAPPSETIARARDVATRFHRMQRTWGPWGLAWWEALLRAADWAASRKVNEQGGAADG